MSPLTPESALKGRSIRGARQLLSEYSFRVGDLSQFITIRLYRLIGTDTVIFEQSHFIHTPTQIDAYRTSAPMGNDETEALGRAVRTLVEHYEEAVRVGHRPQDSWLEPNPDF
ncbi:MAG: hypothetical protein WAO35_24940 [Terriglobia bacterium]